MTESVSAFDGVRVVEACTGIGGAMLAWMLSEQGADIVRVVSPGAEPHAWTGYHVLDRGKRTVALDLETEAGRAALWQLLDRADVFLYDWPPGDDERLGFTPAALRQRCPSLVTGYLPAYGSRGRWAALPPDEALVQAVSAVCDAQYRYEPRPVLVNLPVAGYAQGVVGALSVAASLYARTQSSRGDRFELSQIAATFAMETIAWLRAPSVMRLAGQQDPRGPIPTYRLVQGSDGEWLFCGALTPPFWANLAIALGLEDCLVDERFRGAPMGIANMDDRRELARRVSAAVPVEVARRVAAHPGGGGRAAGAGAVARGVGARPARRRERDDGGDRGSGAGADAADGPPCHPAQLPRPRKGFLSTENTERTDLGSRPRPSR